MNDIINLNGRAKEELLSKSENARLLPLLLKIEELTANGNTIVAIDGRSASGKSTLAEILSKIYDCNLFHVDDFFLRPEQRTAERFAEIGGNFDRERFFDEIIEPLSLENDVCFRRFNCSAQALETPKTVPFKRLTVVEGAYSMHPSLGKYYDISVFLDIDAEMQRKRVLKRNGEAMAKRFFNEWIPLENIYFSEYGIKEKADFVI